MRTRELVEQPEPSGESQMPEPGQEWKTILADLQRRATASHVNNSGQENSPTPHTPQITPRAIQGSARDDAKTTRPAILPVPSTHRNPKVVAHTSIHPKSTRSSIPPLRPTKELTRTPPTPPRIHMLKSEYL